MKDRETMNYTYQRTYRGPIQAVVLDWAGTAVDYGSFAPTAVFLRLFEQRNVQITPADARSGMGLMKKDHLRTILARPAVAVAWQAAHGAPPAESDVDDLFENFIPMQYAVLKDYAQPIPGLLETMTSLRKQNIKVGSTTGYLRGMMDILGPEAGQRGYTPDCIVCPDDVTAGRPAPWMCYRNAMELDVYPMQAMVKVGDTLVDVEEGLNAGMWTIGISLSGNLVGLSQNEIEAMTEAERQAVKQNAVNQLLQAGAHRVIDGIWELPAALADIEMRLQYGEQP